MTTEFLWHASSLDEVFEETSSSPRGLSAAQAETRLKQFGPNEIPKERLDAWWIILLRQCLNPLIFVLVIAAVVSFWLRDFVDMWVILGAVGLNTLIGFIQEWKANRALIQLESFIQPHCLVWREGKQRELLARELVVGDVILLQTGDQVPADARLLEVSDLQCDEAPLTGESLPVTKQIDAMDKGTLLADRINLVFAGTTVVAGRAKALVIATGVHTQIGLIASMLARTSETLTPLQTQLAQLARWIGIVVVVLVIALFALGLWVGKDLFDMFELSVALAVAAIPEGLTVAVTIILAIGMQRILRRGSLVRRLVAAETLGSVSVICSDKTGTLTEGRMQVVEVLTEKTADRVSLLQAILLCNDTQRAQTEQGEVLYGSPTERALFSYALSQSLDEAELHLAHPLVCEIPFNSERKYRATQHTWGKTQKQFVVGAFSYVLEMFGLTQEEKTHWGEKEKQLTAQGYRVVVVGEKMLRHTTTRLDPKKMVGFRLLGFVVLQDPLRADVAQQITAAKQAGIRTILVTGDHPQTAATIGRQAGLSVTEGSVVTGAELDAWSEEELVRRIARVVVFARVEPRHKIRIVQAWQARGEVVAMTGDGVNDAPALKTADIGIAVGTGTEVAKQTADLVLLDNQFSTVTNAIEQGRVMFDNIRKSTVYLMAGSFTELILIGVALFLGLPLPLLPVHILWINLFADSLPTVGLVFEPGERDVMRVAPRSRQESVLNRDMMRMVVVIGVVTNIFLVSLFFWLLETGMSEEVIRTFMFAAVGFDTLIYIFAVKSFRRTIFHINPFSNLWLIGGVLIGFGMMLLALMHPFFQRLFEIVPLRLSDWGLLLMIGVIKLVVIEFVKELYLLNKRRQSPV